MVLVPLIHLTNSKNSQILKVSFSSVKQKPFHVKFFSATSSGFGRRPPGTSFLIFGSGGSGLSPGMSFAVPGPVHSATRQLEELAVNRCRAGEARK
jgi:hypothetical protein